ncbi:NAD(P)/FAD-dependent oxidoreductase [Verminephrobacter eiseniae]|nr:NAD(P)/FAD-dependent oxidoreductase [Verminephrobacter eiseniae]
MAHAVIETDAVVIGAGPVGLFQAFQLGLQGIGAHLIDALPQAGGQCVTLYGDKPIYDIAGIPVCTGRELIDRLLAQLAPFKPHWHMNTLVAALAPQSDARLLLETDAGARLLARSVFIAAGVGAFVPRTLKMAGMERFVGTQLFYQALPAGMDVAGRQVVVHGGDEGAVACAVELAEQGRAARVSLLYRRDLFQAPEALLQRLQQLRAAGRIAVEVGQITGIASSDPQQCSTLRALQVVDAQGASHALPVDVLVAVLGISPRLGPLTDWGMAMARKQLQVDTEAFRTSVPGIYAVGDINTYPGKRRLILCGFHEATLAAFAAAEALKGDKVALQYTTTSAHLHRLLGVAPASGATGP